MKTLKTRRWFDIGIILSLLTLCMNFWMNLSGILHRISVENVPIETIDFNFFKITVVTTVDNYEILFTPFIFILFILGLYVCEFAFGYIKNSIEEYRRTKKMDEK